MHVYPLTKDIDTILCGMGEDNVRHACELLLNKNVKGLICFGTCAALTENINSGDLILAERILTTNNDRFLSAESWRDSIQKYLNENDIPIHEGDIYSSSSVITSPADKLTLAQQTDAIAVDMESAIVFQFAQKNNIPALSLRVVVDEAHVSIPQPVLDNTDEYGQVNIASLLLTVIRQPRLVMDLVTLGRAFSRAKTSMLWVGKHAEQMFLRL